MKVLRLQQEVLNASNSNNYVAVTVPVLREDVRKLMEIKGNAPTAQVEPNTAIGELLVRITSCVLELECTINGTGCPLFCK